MVTHVNEKMTVSISANFVGVLSLHRVQHVGPCRFEERRPTLGHLSDRRLL